MNTSGRTYIAYVFRNIDGFQITLVNIEQMVTIHFLTHNNRNDQHLFTGFRPKLVIIKALTNNWKLASI